MLPITYITVSKRLLNQLRQRRADAMAANPEAGKGIYNGQQRLSVLTAYFDRLESNDQNSTWVDQDTPARVITLPPQSHIDRS